MRARFFYSAAIAGLVLLGCSDAPQLVRTAQRVVFVELFSTLPDE